MDWAGEKHYVIVVDQAGKVIEEFQIEHSALGWKKFREKLQPYGPIPFAIETSQGAVVEQLLEAAMIVYPLNPKSAQAYRQRKAPSGVKDDQLDAWSFADALRVDGHGWKALRPEEPLIKELRLLCRDEVTLIEQRTAFVQQLRHALAEYYPAALEAFENWTSVSAWIFLQRFPTPGALAQAGKRQWQKFLHARRLWGSDQGPRRMEIFAHASEFAGTQPTVNAKSLLALSLVQMLFKKAQGMKHEDPTGPAKSKLDPYRPEIESLLANGSGCVFRSRAVLTRRIPSSTLASPAFTMLGRLVLNSRVFQSGKSYLFAGASTSWDLGWNLDLFVASLGCAPSPSALRAYENRARQIPYENVDFVLQHPFFSRCFCFWERVNYSTGVQFCGLCLRIFIN